MVLLYDSLLQIFLINHIGCVCKVEGEKNRKKMGTLTLHDIQIYIVNWKMMIPLRKHGNNPSQSQSSCETSLHFAVLHQATNSGADMLHDFDPIKISTAT